MKKLSTISQIKAYFSNNSESYYFVSASNFNLMPIHSWVKNWFNVNIIDCYSGKNPSVLLPKYGTKPLFEDIEQINTFLLGNKQVVEHVKNQQKQDKANVFFLFYNKELEEITNALAMNKIMPSNKLVKKIDSKITTTEIGNNASVPSVPNALVKIDNYQDLLNTQTKFNLTTSVVVQTPYGDSGKTTFFIENEVDYRKYAEKIEAEKQVKIMQKIDCLQVAIEAVATENGTFIGPILSEIIGEKRLTPYAGGWCGNDIGAMDLSKKVEDTIYQNTKNLGNALYQKGYRGYFEVDYLLDKNNNNEVYLGEINPRVTGISALTNMSTFCQQNIPLFLLHLLEYSNIKIDLSAQEFNKKSQDFDHPPFGQLIFKYLKDELKIITSIPKTGIYKQVKNTIEFIRYASDATSLQDGEFYILQIMQIGEYTYKGADLLILFTNSKLKSTNGELNISAKTYIDLIENNTKYRELTAEEAQLVARYGQYAPIKASEDSE
jgi:hypothetical protein